MPTCRMRKQPWKRTIYILRRSVRSSCRCHSCGCDTCCGSLRGCARARAGPLCSRPRRRWRSIDARGLFLRPFADDHVSLASVPMSFLASLFDPISQQTHVEALLQTCVSLGPAVSIGRPDDDAPPVGVPRAYVGADWHAAVTTLMDAASLIVVAISDFLASYGKSIKSPREATRKNDRRHAPRAIARSRPPAARRDHARADVRRSGAARRARARPRRRSSCDRRARIEPAAAGPHGSWNAVAGTL